MTPREQRLRNECGQLTHRNIKLADQIREMQADLIRQRQDMQDAITALDAGSVRDAVRVLQSGLDYRARTRQPRKTKEAVGG